LPVAARRSMPPFHHEHDQKNTQSCLNLMIQLPNATPHPTTLNPTPLPSSHWLLCLKMTIQRTNLACRCSALHAPFHHEHDQKITQSCLNLTIQLPNATPHPTNSHPTPLPSSHWLLCLKMTIQRTNRACRCSALHAPFHHEHDQKITQSCLNLMIQLPNATPHPTNSHPTPLPSSHWLLCLKMTIQRTNLACRCSALHAPFPPRT